MKNVRFVSLFIIFFLKLIIHPTMATELPSVFEVDIKAHDLFIPHGFDSNDNVEVVLTGHLPNLCYKSPHAVVTKNNNVVSVTIKAYLSLTNMFCPMVIVPFTLTAGMGTLEAGEYQINNEDLSQSKNLIVEKAKDSNIDDHIYAQVNYVETNPDSKEVILHAMNPSPACLSYSHTELVPNPEKNVIAILPIMKRSGENCPTQMTSFKISITIPPDLAKDNVLLHVRSMDGKSANAIFHINTLGSEIL